MFFIPSDYYGARPAIDKKFVHENNPSGDLSLNNLKSLEEEGICSVTPEEWDRYCRHKLYLEDVYWERDGQIQSPIDDL